MNSTIGKKVKELRQQHNLTLKELSQKTGLSSGYLSQFERGQTTIAIDNLEQIAKFFNVELSYFLEKFKETSSPVVRNYEQLDLQITNEQFISQSLVRTKEQASFLPRIVEILPSKQIIEEVELFDHKGTEFVYVLEGVLDLHLEKETYCLYPGDSAYYSSNEIHNWVNNSTRITKFLVVNQG